jgi:hypothetical protein
MLSAPCELRTKKSIQLPSLSDKCSPSDAVSAQ